MGEPLGSVGHQGRVLRPRALDDRVAGDQRAATVGQVDGVARRGATVADPVADDGVPGGAGLELVADVSTPQVAAGDGERTHRADVDVVGVPVPAAVAEEARAPDHDVAAGVGAGEDAVLVVVEPAAGDGEPGALLADAGAVAVGHGGAAELDAVDDRVVAGNHPDGLALGALPGSLQVRSATCASEGEVVLAPGRNVADVRPCVDEDRVTVLRDRSRLTGEGQRPVRSYPPRARAVSGLSCRRGAGGRRAEGQHAQARQGRCYRPGHRGPHRTIVMLCALGRRICVHELETLDEGVSTSPWDVRLSPEDGLFAISVRGGHDLTATGVNNDLVATDRQHASRQMRA